MPLIAQYDESDAYLSQEDYDNLDEETQEFLEPEAYDEDSDQMHYNDFKYEVKEAFSKRKFPLNLRANSSRWDGATGYAECSSVDDVLAKISSFGGSYTKLHRGRGGRLWFQTANHDRPTGFSIDVLSIK